MKAHKDTSRKKRRRLISFHSTSCRERKENKKIVEKNRKKKKKKKWHENCRTWDHFSTLVSNCALPREQKKWLATNGDPMWLPLMLDTSTYCDTLNRGAALQIYGQRHLLSLSWPPSCECTTSGSLGPPPHRKGISLAALTYASASNPIFVGPKMHSIRATRHL